MSDTPRTEAHFGSLQGIVDSETHAAKHFAATLERENAAMKALTEEGVEIERPVKAHFNNLENLRHAFASNLVALMETEVVATGERVAAICMVNISADESVEFVPVAVMMNGNPYKLLNPCKPGGGFASQEEVWRQHEE